MKTAKTTVISLSVLYTTCWAGLLVFDTILKLQEPSSDEFSLASSFIKLSVIGLFFAIILSANVFAFFADKKHRILKTTSLVVCTAANALYLVSVYGFRTAKLGVFFLIVRLCVCFAVLSAMLMIVQLAIFLAGKYTAHRKSISA